MDVKIDEWRLIVAMEPAYGFCKRCFEVNTGKKFITSDGLLDETVKHSAQTAGRVYYVIAGIGYKKCVYNYFYLRYYVGQ